MWFKCIVCTYLQVARISVRSVCLLWYVSTGGRNQLHCSRGSPYHQARLVSISIHNNQYTHRLFPQEVTGRRGNSYPTHVVHPTPPAPAPRTHHPQQPILGSNPPIPLRRNQSLHKTGQDPGKNGPSVPPRHTSREKLDLPPPLPPKSPDPLAASRTTEVSPVLAPLQTSMVPVGYQYGPSCTLSSRPVWSQLHTE